MVLQNYTIYTTYLLQPLSDTKKQFCNSFFYYFAPYCLEQQQLI